MSEKREAKSKKRKVESVKPKVSGTEVVEVKAAENQSATEGTFDFGGLPERNLKKNLGCG